MKISLPSRSILVVPILATASLVSIGICLIAMPAVAKDPPDWNQKNRNQKEQLKHHGGQQGKPQQFQKHARDDDSDKQKSWQRGRPQRLQREDHYNDGPPPWQQGRPPEPRRYNNYNDGPPPPWQQSSDWQPAPPPPYRPESGAKFNINIGF
jgi:hypothetical protein